MTRTLLACLKMCANRRTSGPVDAQLARFHDHVFIPAREFHQIHEQFHDFLAILANYILAAFAPPLHNFHAVSRFLVSQGLPREIVEFNSVSQPAVQIHQQVKRFAE